MKLTISSLLCIVFMLSGTQPVFSQDIHFAPFDAAQMTMNPAYTGMFNGSVRVSGLYQNIWSSATVPSVTYGVSADMPVYTDHNGDYLAAGLQVVRDQAGDGNLNNFTGIASVAYHKLFGKINSNKNCDLAIGIQGEYSQKDINLSAIYFGNEFSNFSLITPYTPYYIALGNIVNYSTINSGISFSQATGSKFSYTVGVSANNFNQSNSALEKTQHEAVGDELNYVATFGANWVVLNRLTIRPAVLYLFEQSYTDMIAGSEFQYAFGSSTHRSFVNNAFIGAWYISGYQLRFTAGTQLGKCFRIGLGYEFGFVSTHYYIPSGNDLNGFELQIQYIAPRRPSGDHKRFVPCNRF